MKFSDSLDRKLEEIKRPPNLPVGHYTWQVDKHPDVEEGETREGKPYERVTFQMICVEASDDVDPDELEEYGNVQGARNRKSFFFSNDPEETANFARTEFNLRRFLDHLGVDESLALGEALAASVGAQCLAELTHRPDPNDPEVVYSEIGRTAPL